MRKAKGFWALVVLAWLMADGTSALAAKKNKNPEPASAPDAVRVWPPPPQKPRIKLLQVINGEGDVVVKAKRGFLARLVGDRSEEGFLRLRRPFALTGDRQGRLYVTDTYLRGVFVMDPAQRTFQVFAAESEVRLRQPLGIAVDSQDRVWVADASLRSVLCFDQEEKLLMMFGTDPGQGKQKTPTLERPTGLALDEQRQRVYIADAKLHQIFVFDMKGKLIRQLGGPGSEPGQFAFPGALAVDRAGRLLVVDTMNARIQIFDPNFELVRTLGTRGDTPGSLAQPKGVAVDSAGHLYVTDAMLQNFQIFGHDSRDADSDQLSVLLFVGEPGRRPGDFQLPGGIYIDSHNQIFVADQLNGRVQVFEFLGDDEN